MKNPLPEATLTALTRLWSSSLVPQAKDPVLREQDIKAVYDLGLGLQEVVQYLYQIRPTLDQFLEWSASYQLVENPVSTTEEALTEDDLKHWDEHGYVVLHQAVPPVLYQEANQAIWKFLDADPAVPDSWYRPHPAKSGLMVVMTQHPALHAIRQSPRIRKAFEQLYGHSSIYLVVDKVSFNPPETPSYTFAGSGLHWDTSLELPIPFRLQGLIYLSDVTAEGGAFQCVPGFHHQIEAWLKQVPEGVEPRRHAIETLNPVSVPGKAGDLIIWHQALPHCASPNRGQTPRLVQYLTYLPDGFEDQRSWM